MAIRLVKEKSPASLPVYLIKKSDFDKMALPPLVRDWLKVHQFKAGEGEAVLYPDGQGRIAGAVIGLGDGNNPFTTGILPQTVKKGCWHFADMKDAFSPSFLHYLGILLGDYRFHIYKEKEKGEFDNQDIEFFLPSSIDEAELSRQAGAISLTRDLINTPANHMGPAALEQASLSLARRYGAVINVIKGEALLEQNFPLIHAVGRAGHEEPRLIDFCWGNEKNPKITLVGKGVCFDTGGLDIKPARGMELMKKDMGGAANVLGLAVMIMDAGLPIRLRVLIPAVENSIAGNAMRPGDIIKSRQGLHIEIGNTDAEGRLVLADALSFAAEEAPDLMIDMATLTGAARVALGADLPPFFSDDDSLVRDLEKHVIQTHDPLWRLPLWQPYMKNLSSPIADMNNVTSDGLGGAITAALFLSRFTQGAKSWVHFDIYGWTPIQKPGFPKGGEAQGIRALYSLLKKRYQI